MDLIPDTLRRNNEDGNVVFFCGAGVSVPAGLPNFKKLVWLVLTDLLPSAEECTSGTTEALAWKAYKEERYDEALGILETTQHGGFEAEKVRQKVIGYLSKKPKMLEHHLTLSLLADLDREDGRLVTTNFDDLFEKSQRKLCRQESSQYKMPVFMSPALPPAKPEAFRGLIYLHGKLGRSPNNHPLVLTTADFGMAYMLEGWALRFVIDLFRLYHVVFIGYSVKDPTMRYLVSAISAAREESRPQFKQPYVFAPYSSEQDQQEIEQEWKLIGITPLLYNDTKGHQELWGALKKWADDHRQGIIGRRQMVARLGQVPPVADQNDPVIQDMVWALSDADVAKYFAELADESRPRLEWITPLQKAGLLNLSIGETDDGQDISTPLVSRFLIDHQKLNDVTFQLGVWVSKCLDSQVVLDWALSEGGVLHKKFRRQIRQLLKDEKTQLSPGFRKIWQVLANDSYALLLSEKNESDNFLGFTEQPLTPNSSFAIRSFLNRLRPLPVLKKKHDFFMDGVNRDPSKPNHWCEMNLELVGIEHDYEISRLCEQAEDWEGTLAVIADELTTYLHEAMDWLCEFGLANHEEDITHVEYRSISPHEQNKHAKTWTQLIALTRDSYEAIVAKGDNCTAERLVRRWLSLPYPVFRRLVLYAITDFSVSDINFGLEILLNEHRPSLWDYQIMRETLRFLRKRGQHFHQDQLDTLIEAILKGPPRQWYREDLSNEKWCTLRDGRIILRLHKLKESGASLPNHAQETYDRIQTELNWELSGDHSEEFPVYMSSGSDAFELLDTGTLENFEEMSIEQFIQWSNTQVGEGFFPWECGGGWHQFVENNIQAAVTLLKNAAAKDSWSVPPWYTVLGFMERNNSDTSVKELNSEIANLLTDMPVHHLVQLALQAARWLESAWQQINKRTRKKLWRKIWDASIQGEYPEDNLDFDMTLNHAGGLLGNVLYEELTELIPNVAAGQSPGFPKQVKPRFNLLTDNKHPSAKLARVRLAPMLFALYRINPEWTNQTFFIRMDTEDEAKFDPYLWEGFFWYSRCPPDLLAAFKRPFLKILQQLGRVPERVRTRAVNCFVNLSVPPHRGINTNEAKAICWKLGPDRLADAAMALSYILEAARDRSPVLWRDTIAPWFNKVWPTRSQDKSANLSEKLAWMAIESYEAFPHVVDAIEDKLVPEEWNLILHRLSEKEEETHIISTHPKQTLMLVDKISSPRSDGEYLRRILEIISNAAPNLTDTASYKRLSRKADN